MGTREDVLGVLYKVLDVKEQDLKLEQSLQDSLGVDSTEIVELTVALGKQLGVKLDQNDISKTSTPEQIIEAVKKKKQ